MKILDENNFNQATEQDTVYVYRRIDRIIQTIFKTKFIMGDNESICNLLDRAKRHIDRLINDLRAENNKCVYYSGSSEEFLSRDKDAKKECISFGFDDESELDTIIAMIEYATSLPDKERTSALTESYRQLGKLIN